MKRRLEIDCVRISSDVNRGLSVTALRIRGSLSFREDALYIRRVLCTLTVAR